MPDLTVSDVGEKALIAKVVRPLFDGSAALPLIGNDCAVLSTPPDADVLVSTDRVPADLIAFRLQLIDHYGLGRYLAFLNISDIAACGGTPAGLLLNMGLPSHLLLKDFESLCHGVHDAAQKCGCRVVGGDISGSAELSLSATAVGFAPRRTALTRTGARPGDDVFITRKLGLTPAAFAYFLGLRERLALNPAHVDELRGQFTDIFPMVTFGRWLREQGHCTSCMDNTDGIAQSFAELAEESGVAIVLDRDLLTVPEVVTLVASEAGVDPIDLALGPGADFSLVGTMSPDFAGAPPAAEGIAYARIGRVEAGKGVHLNAGTARQAIEATGWNYFVREVRRG